MATTRRLTLQLVMGMVVSVLAVVIMASANVDSARQELQDYCDGTATPDLCVTALLPYLLPGLGTGKVTRHQKMEIVLMASLQVSFVKAAKVFKQITSSTPPLVSPVCVTKLPNATSDLGKAVATMMLKMMTKNDAKEEPLLTQQIVMYINNAEKAAEICVALGGFSDPQQLQYVNQLIHISSQFVDEFSNAGL